MGRETCDLRSIELKEYGTVEKRQSRAENRGPRQVLGHSMSATQREVTPRAVAREGEPGNEATLGSAELVELVAEIDRASGTRVTRMREILETAREFTASE
jgi:hypothetical protein